MRSIISGLTLPRSRQGSRLLCRFCYGTHLQKRRRWRHPRRADQGTHSGPDDPPRGRPPSSLNNKRSLILMSSNWCSLLVVCVCPTPLQLR